MSANCSSVDQQPERRAFLESLGIGIPLMIPNSSTNEIGEETAVKNRIIDLVRRIPSDLFNRLPHPAAVPRLIVIDGCNIGRASCGSGREKVNCLGLLCVARYFVVRGFDVVIFIPSSYNNALNQNVAFSTILAKLQTMGILGFTASRTAVNSRRRGIQLNYDDLYVLDYAAQHGGSVLSGDFYEDILNDARHSQFIDVIRNRRFGIRFHNFGEILTKMDDDIFYRCFPEVYSLGTNETVVNPDRMMTRLFAAPDNAEYNLAKNRRSNSWTRERQIQLLNNIDSLINQTVSESNIKITEFTSGLPRAKTLSAVSVPAPMIVNPVVINPPVVVNPELDFYSSQPIRPLQPSGRSHRLPIDFTRPQIPIPRPNRRHRCTCCRCHSHMYSEMVSSRRYNQPNRHYNYPTVTYRHRTGANAVGVNSSRQRPISPPTVESTRPIETPPPTAHRNVVLPSEFARQWNSQMTSTKLKDRSDRLELKNLKPEDIFLLFVV
ncbi:hypothetical protein M3Y94_01112000 [Aphelenchoides besseyi]|nr:hypothetical protein M3Y94_01112000 [Aphelenchoides besseyi]KAI6221505.1 hypothetical protein M3Y95_00969000 [Aphelenchoides besseyi]